MGIGIAIKGAAAALSSSNTYKLQCAKLCNRRKIWTISKLTYKPILKKICEIPARITPPLILEFVVFYTNQKILWDGMRLVCSFFWSFFFWNWKPRSILVTHVAHSGIRAKFFQAANRRVEYVYLYERTEKNWNNIFSMYFFLFLKVLLIPLI